MRGVPGVEEFAQMYVNGIRVEVDIFRANSVVARVVVSRKAIVTKGLETVLS